MTHTKTLTHRLALLLALAGVLLPKTALSQAVTSMTFLPPCAIEKPASFSEADFGGETPDVEDLLPPVGNEDVTCAEFTAKDPQTLETRTLKAGDELAVAVVIENPTKAPVTDARAWIAYDPKVLQGKSVAIEPQFSQTTPGESDFSVEEGYVKIGASTANGLTGDRVVLAIVTFTVLEPTSASTSLSFYDPGKEAANHTTVTATRSDVKEPILDATPPTLLIRLAQESSSSVQTSSVTNDEDSSQSLKAAAVESSSAVSSSTSSSAVSSSASSVQPAPATIFPNLQIANLRVTTQGSAVYLGWDMLPSAELVGYNIYYSATSGQYLQRKTIDKSESTLTLRGLPENVPYFFAVRGVNAVGIETEFSREVSVTVGKPQTSTAPLSASVITGPNGKPPKTPGNVSGETGMASTAVILLVICALAGTLIAGRRQFIAVSGVPYAS